jgi:predicted secreted protein
MAGELIGRACVISIGSVPWAAARTKNLTINNEPVDVTADGDDGIQRYLSVPGRKSIEVTLEAVYDTNSPDLIDLALGDNLIESVELDYGSYTISGNFFMSSLGNALPHEDAITVSVTFQSSGAIVKSAS